MTGTLQRPPRRVDPACGGSFRSQLFPFPGAVIRNALQVNPFGKDGKAGRVIVGPILLGVDVIAGRAGGEPDGEQQVGRRGWLHFERLDAEAARCHALVTDQLTMESECLTESLVRFSGIEKSLDERDAIAG